MKLIRNLTVVGSAALLLMIAQGCSSVASPDAPLSAGMEFSSPEEVYKAANHAARKQDFNTYLDCFSEPAERRMSSYLFNVGLVLADRTLDRAALGMGKDSDAYSIMDVVEKYKLGERYEDPDEIPDPKTRRKFSVEMMKAISALNENDSDTFTLGVSELTGVKTEGDTAIGKSKLTNGKSTPVHFVKEGDRWKIEWDPET